MTNIVERLRATAAHFERVAKSSQEKSHATGLATEMREAANEIERLYAEGAQTFHEAADTIKQQGKEIAWLRELIRSTRLPLCGCGRNPKTMSLLDELKL